MCKYKTAVGAQNPLQFQQADGQPAEIGAHAVAVRDRRAGVNHRPQRGLLERAGSRANPVPLNIGLPRPLVAENGAVSRVVEIVGSC